MARLSRREALDPELYRGTVERRDEMARLQAQMKRRKSVLIHGPEGVGKTRWLRKFIATEPLALYLPQLQSPREVLLTITAEIRRTGEEIIGGSLGQRLTTTSLKGIVQRALDRNPYLLAVDHVSGPSRVVCGLIKDLSYFDRTPVILVSRSAHMEDIGTLGPMCAGRNDRIEIKEFPLPIALQFAREQASGTHLNAANLEDFLAEIVARSNGNPGSIVQMVRMAHLPHYRSSDQIKVHVLYLDFRMGRR